MLAQEPHVAAVGAPGDVEHVAGDGNGADHAFDHHVADHAQQQRARHAEPLRLEQQPAGERRGHHVADTGHQAKNGLDAEANIRSRHQEGDVEQPRQTVEPLQARARGPRCAVIAVIEIRNHARSPEVAPDGVGSR